MDSFGVVGQISRSFFILPSKPATSHTKTVEVMLFWTMQLNNRTHISTRMTSVLWLVVGPLTILWTLLPIYLIWRDGIGNGLFLLIINGVISFVVLRWIGSFYEVSYDDKYLYVTQFRTERKINLTEIRRILQGNFKNEF